MFSEIQNKANVDADLKHHQEETRKHFKDVIGKVIDMNHTTSILKRIFIVKDV